MEDLQYPNKAIQLLDWEKDTVLKKAVGLLVEAFQPEKVFLFGSRANDTHKENSDYDLLLVVESSSEKRFERELKAIALIRNLEASFDIFIYTKTEFDSWKDELSSIPETASNTGWELLLG